MGAHKSQEGLIGLTCAPTNLIFFKVGSQQIHLSKVTLWGVGLVLSPHRIIDSSAWTTQRGYLHFPTNLVGPKASNVPLFCTFPPWSNYQTNCQTSKTASFVCALLAASLTSFSTAKENQDIGIRFALLNGFKCEISRPWLIMNIFEN